MTHCFLKRDIVKEIKSQFLYIEIEYQQNINTFRETTVNCDTIIM